MNPSKAHDADRGRHATGGGMLSLRHGCTSGRWKFLDSLASISARLVAQQQQSLVQRVKPGMDAAGAGQAVRGGQGLRRCVWMQPSNRSARECQCALINTAALLKATSAEAIPDLTARGCDILKQPALGAPAQ